MAEKKTTILPDDDGKARAARAQKKTAIIPEEEKRTGEKPKGERSTRILTEDEERRPRGDTVVLDEGGNRKRYRRPAKTRGIFLLLGFLLVLLAGWLGWRYYKTGQLPDLSSPEGQRKAAEDLKKDAEEVKEGALKVYSYTLADLDERMKRLNVEAPKNDEERRTLIEESKKAVDAPPETAVKKTVEATEPAAALKGPLADAQRDFQLASRAYARSGPEHSQQDRQVHLRVAKHFFERCLNHIDKARAQGISDRELRSIEEPATKRLYDCNKQLEMKPEYDRLGDAAIRTWK